MISAKQVQNILEYSFAGGADSFLAPTASFNADPSNYADTNVPGAITLSGTIIPNDALNINWNITASTSTTPIASGTGNSVTHSLGSIPSTIGTTSYNLNISYQDSANVTYSLTVVTTITVSAAAKIGQLSGPSDNFTSAAEFTALGVESGFTVKTQNEVINLFEYTASVSPTARIVIIVPTTYGTLADIQDSVDGSVLDEFTAITDGPNNRILYVTQNTLSPATYHYKLVF